jgi:hypothetical protein
MDAPSTALLIAADPADADVLRIALAGKPITLDVAYDFPTAIRCLDSSRYCGVIVQLAHGGQDVLHHMSVRHISLPTIVISKRRTTEVDTLAIKVLGLCGIEA